MNNKFQVGKTYHNFKLIDEQDISEINSTGRIFRHETSGAKLVYFSNDDDNKVFSISFRTPPDDHSGIPHILEHSVLCGSKKFPVKEPFVELAKGSLNTFLNAMTFPDKTMYPVASRNDKDLYNLMDVYLDAVLHPKIYDYPEILMQEGWHYELENREKKLNYVGVVYNEMKGVFSSPESILYRKIQESLFPDNTYGFESGGDPDYIPELTQEKFIGFHKKFYHPSNSFLYLYGNGNVSEHLKFIDSNYLKDFKAQEVNSTIPFHKAFDSVREQVIEYPLMDSEATDDKTFLSLNIAIGRATDPEIYLAFDILEYLLMGTSASPLKKALLDESIGKDIFGSFDNGILQPVFSVIAKNSEEKLKNKFLEVIFRTLENLVTGGIDKKQVEAAINIHEFHLREADFRNYPKGLVYNFKILDSWLHGADPFMHLRYEKILEKIKTALKEDYFEQLIKKYILENHHRSLLIVKPKRSLDEIKRKELDQKLSRHKENLSDDELDNLIKETERLKINQSETDSPQDLARIPLLALADINKNTEKLPQIEIKKDNYKILLHPHFTGNIAYLNLYFDSNPIPLADLPYLNLLSSILGKTNTREYEYSDLTNEINIQTGGINFFPSTFSENNSSDLFYPKFIVKSKSMVEKHENLFHLINEIIHNTGFGDKKRIREIIREKKSRMEMAIIQQGHSIASSRLFANFSPLGKYNEILSGLTFYWFLSDLEKNFDKKFEELTNKLEEVSGALFRKNGLIASVTTRESDFRKLEKGLLGLTDRLSDKEISQSPYSFDYSKRNEALLSPSKVQYVVQGFNYRNSGHEYSGELQVLKSIISLDYLWNRVRVQGGAYGSFARFSRNGNMFLGSYRDPNLVKTLEIYKGLPGYLKNFQADKRQMTKYIIGTISNIDTPLTPSMKGEAATDDYISHLSLEEKQKERDEILGTTEKGIRDKSRLIEDLVKENYYCVLGNDKILKDNENLFDELLNIFS